MTETAKRPAEFDKRLADSMNLIRWFAVRHTKNDDEKEDLMQEIMLRALEKWENFREDGSFSQWLKYLTWQIVSARKSRKTLGTISGHDGAWDGVSHPARQDDIVDAKRVLAAASGSELLCRLALGDKIAEIARERGVHRVAVGQMAARHRQKHLHGMMVAA